jgi:hypothetical protein
VRVRALVAGGLVLLAACSSSSSAPKALPSTTRPVERVTACASRTPFGTSGSRNEVRVRTTRGVAWGLAVEGALPPRPGETVKIVWRVTGHGPLRVVFTAPDGRTHALVFGPEQHATSTYHRPGDEWGTGFRFPTGGCWRIHLARDDAAGDVWIDV